MTTTINATETYLTLRFDAQLNFVEAENDTEFNVEVSDDLVQRARNTVGQFRHLVPEHVNQTSEHFHFSVRSDEEGVWVVEAIDYIERDGTSVFEEIYEGPLLSN